MNFIARTAVSSDNYGGKNEHLLTNQTVKTETPFPLLFHYACVHTNHSLVLLLFPIGQYSEFSIFQSRHVGCRYYLDFRSIL